MRYKTIYSIALMFWIFTTSFTQKHQIIMKFSLVIGLPFALFQILCFYFVNLRENLYKIDFDNMQIFGFMTDFEYNELEYIIMIIYICFHISYARQVKTKYIVMKSYKTYQSQKETIEPRILSLNDKKDSKIPKSDIEMLASSKENKLSNVVIAIVSKYSDIFSLFILFWISMYTVNVMHLILAFFFLLFSIQLGTSISSTQNSLNKKKTTYNFLRRFWVFLIVYVNFIIFLRYFWVAFIVPYCGDKFSNYPAVLFLGITYNYDISPSFGLVTEGFLFCKINYLSIDL